MKQFIFIGIVAFFLSVLGACNRPFTERMVYDFQPEQMNDSVLHFSTCSLAKDNMSNVAIVPEIAEDSQMQPVVYKSSFFISDTDYAHPISFCADNINAGNVSMMINGAVVQEIKEQQTCGYSLNGYIVQGENDISLILARPKENSAIVNARILIDFDVHTELIWQYLPQIPSIKAKWYLPNPEPREWPGYSFFHDILGSPTPVVIAPEWIKISLEKNIDMNKINLNDRLLSRTVWQTGAAWYRFDFNLTNLSTPLSFRAVGGGDGAVWVNGYRVEMKKKGHFLYVDIPSEYIQDGDNTLIFCLATRGAYPNITAAELRYAKPQK